MDESFELPVIYRGTECLFSTRLLQLGYTHKFQVVVDEMEIIFEPDEERAYRAIVDPESMSKHLDAGLLQAIAAAIENVLK